MKNISDYIGQTLVISQPKFFKRLYELKYEETLLASVQTIGFFGNSLLINGELGNWEIYKPSIWRSHIEVRGRGKELPFAKFINQKFKSGGTIELPMGRRLKLSSNFWKGTYELQNLSGLCLALFRNKISLKEKMLITIEAKSELLDKNPWALVLVWFVALQRRQHAAAAAG